MTIATALGFLFLAGTGTVHAQAPWTKEQMREDVAQIADAVREHWSYLESHRERFGVDVDRLEARAIEEVDAVGSSADFARVLRRFAAGLRDGHAWCRLPGEPPEPPRRLPFEVIDAVEGLVVSAVAEGVTAPGVGDLLKTIDGRDVESGIAEFEREETASTPGMRRAKAIATLLERSAARAEIEIEDLGGARRMLLVDTIPAFERFGAPKPENWSLSWPADHTAMLHLSSFAVARWKEWLEAKPEEREPFLTETKTRIDAIVAQLLERGAKALIVDLRGNGGGTDSLGIHLASRLLAGEFRYFLLSARRDGEWSEPSGMIEGRHEAPRFLGELVLLIDAGSFSTTDNFARCLDDLHPRCVIVGRPSGGGTGAPRQWVEATHSKAVIGGCTMRVCGPNEKLIEGRGTIPDVVVEWTRDDVIAGRDPDLAAALAIAEK